MAPEVFRHEQYNNKVDVYSFAMICYQLFEGVPPFWTLDPVEAARAASMDGKRPTWGTLNKRGEVGYPPPHTHNNNKGPAIDWLTCGASRGGG